MTTTDRRNLDTGEWREYYRVKIWRVTEGGQVHGERLAQHKGHEALFLSYAAADRVADWWRNRDYHASVLGPRFESNEAAERNARR